MNNLVNNLGHIVISTVVIIAVTILAWHGTISGADAFGVIGVVGGVSMGGSVASSSPGNLVPGSATGPALISVAGSAPGVITTQTPVAVFPTTTTPSTPAATA